MGYDLEAFSGSLARCRASGTSDTLILTLVSGALLIGLGFLSLLVIRPIGPASAQADIARAVVDKLTALAAKVESSCADDIKKFCSTVTPGEGRIIYRMQAHEDRIGPKCAYDLEEAATNVQTSIDDLKEAIVACKAEITGVCGNIVPGQGRIARA